ncbi:hypothetical protein ACFVW1_41830 [Streptomyces olivochromogenes]
MAGYLAAVMPLDSLKLIAGAAVEPLAVSGAKRLTLTWRHAALSVAWRNT